MLCRLSGTQTRRVIRLAWSRCRGRHGRTHRAEKPSAGDDPRAARQRDCRKTPDGHGESLRVCSMIAPDGTRSGRRTNVLPSLRPQGRPAYVQPVGSNATVAVTAFLREPLEIFRDRRVSVKPEWEAPPAMWEVVDNGCSGEDGDDATFRSGGDLTVPRCRPRTCPRRRGRRRNRPPSRIALVWHRVCSSRRCRRMVHGNGRRD